MQISSSCGKSRVIVMNKIYLKLKRFCFICLVNIEVSGKSLKNKDNETRCLSVNKICIGRTQQFFYQVANADGLKRFNYI